MKTNLLTWNLQAGRDEICNCFKCSPFSYVGNYEKKRSSGLRGRF